MISARVSVNFGDNMASSSDSTNIASSSNAGSFQTGGSSSSSADPNIVFKQRRLTTFEITSVENRFKPPNWAETPPAAGQLTLFCSDNPSQKFVMTKRHTVIGSDPNTCDVVIPGLASEHGALVYHRSGKPYLSAFAEAWTVDEMGDDRFEMPIDKYEEINMVPCSVRFGHVKIDISGKITSALSAIKARKRTYVEAENDSDDDDLENARTFDEDEHFRTSKRRAVAVDADFSGGAGSLSAQRIGFSSDNSQKGSNGGFDSPLGRMGNSGPGKPSRTISSHLLPPAITGVVTPDKSAKQRKRESNVSFGGVEESSDCD